jgi:hypothetical protein
MELKISGIMDKNRTIYLEYIDGDRSAEIVIPDYKLIRNDGFSKEEIEGLMQYSRDNSLEFFNRAKKINPMTAFLGKSGEDDKKSKKPTDGVVIKKQ